MRTRVFNPEVLYADERLVTVNASDIDSLRAAALKNHRKRIRLCAHPSTTDPLHEMLIVLGQQTYIRPHKHPHKSESFHVIEGTAEAVMLSDEGEVSRVLSLGDFASGRSFFYRLDEPIFHTLIIRSPVLIVHETTNGPFNPADTVFAPWAPLETDAGAVNKFVSDLAMKVDRWKR